MPKITAYPKSDFFTAIMGLIPLHLGRLGFKILALNLALSSKSRF